MFGILIDNATFSEDSMCIHQPQYSIYMDEHQYQEPHVHVLEVFPTPSGPVSLLYGLSNHSQLPNEPQKTGSTSTSQNLFRLPIAMTNVNIQRSSQLSMTQLTIVGTNGLSGSHPKRRHRKKKELAEDMLRKKKEEIHHDPKNTTKTDCNPYFMHTYFENICTYLENEGNYNGKSLDTQYFKLIFLG
ncbi:hypothetical protein O181_083831 [Austropuccinia psidii MF-1]|uniref:Uncharacterized protein n=1 Tax=Austropuccinia psidii MF-1 TaxID=1389203 RepID=A0A9Q3FVC4_9BASI|nr:hypothetical protein [Austropuccinia psidii MF-1]